MESVIALLGFTLAAYSVVGNDSIQTLGTFLTSNEDKPWWLLWIFAGGIMAIVVTMGYLGLGEYLGGRGGDLTFGKYAGLFQDPDKPIDFPTISIWYVLPPLALLAITRLGIPVSTTFLVLTFFAPKALPKMLVKSLGGLWRGVPFCHLGICGFESDYGALFPPASYGEKPRNPALQGVLDGHPVAGDRFSVEPVVDARPREHLGLLR